MNMKVIGYVRVSTKDQAKEGISLEAQEEKIRAYCVVKDWELLNIYKEEGISAKSLDRTEMQEVLKLVNEKKVDVVIVYKLDRLTRSVVDLNMLVKLFDSNGVSLVSLQESLDATTATGRLMMNLLASVSQWEREVIGERTKMAMKYLMDNKKIHSRPIYGYNITGKMLIENATEQKNIRTMDRLRRRGNSYWEIAKQMNTKEAVCKRGGKWRASTVRGILTRSSL
jgi:DNA invertase Pin-like site-specific DNA recombinase